MKFARKIRTALRTITNDWPRLRVGRTQRRCCKRGLKGSGRNAFRNDGVSIQSSFVEGLIARMTKDDQKARAAFTAARAEQEKIVQSQPNYGPPWCVLGLIDAALGRDARSTARGPPRRRTSSSEKGCGHGPANDSISGDDCRVGWRQRSGLRTACHCCASSKLDRAMVN